MSELDIGTLSGSITIEDQLSSVLESLSAKVEQFADHFKGTIGSLVLGGAAVVAGIGAISAAIVELGSKGSEINDVKENFDRLSGSVEQADATMEAMRKGTAGTIDN